MLRRLGNDLAENWPPIEGGQIMYGILAYVFGVLQGEGKNNVFQFICLQAQALICRSAIDNS